MRARGLLNQLLAVILAALVAAPAYCFEPAPAVFKTHNRAQLQTYPKTRIRGSREIILLHFRAVRELNADACQGCEKSCWKIVSASLVTYDYDAFGNLLHITGTTPNVYRFAGEQWDPDLNFYYNRARYLNTGEASSADHRFCGPRFFLPHATESLGGRGRAQ